MASLLAGWLFLATATWLYLNLHRGIDTSTLFDTALPSRWARLRVAIGDHYIADAPALLSRGEYGKALLTLRAGVARSPANPRGRLALAQLYLQFSRLDLASETLDGGLPFLAHDISYIREVLRFHLEFQQDAAVTALCEQLQLRHPTGQAAADLALFAATAAFHRGNYDRAETLLASRQLERSLDGALLHARIDWERGYPDLALTHLDALLASDIPAAPVAGLAAQISRQIGQLDRSELYTTQILASSPFDFTPQIELLHLHHERSQADRLNRETDSYLVRFQRDENALLALGAFAAETARPDLADRVRAACLSQKFAPETPALLAAEARIAAGRHTEGLELVRRCADEHPVWARHFAPVLDGLQAAALLGLGRDDEARLRLEYLLAQPNLRSDNLAATARRATALGHPEFARALLARAVAADPLNQAALTSLVRLETEGSHFDTLPIHLRQLLAMRKPSRDVLALAERHLGGDLNLFTPGQAGLLAELRAATATPRTGSR